MLDRDLHRYLGYKYLSCPRLGLKKSEDQTFSILDFILLIRTIWSKIEKLWSSLFLRPKRGRYL